MKGLNFEVWARMASILFVNVYCFTEVINFQLTAWLALGSLGVIAVSLATVETGREHGMSLKKRKMEELLARIWRKQRPVTPRDAQVLSSCIFFIYLLVDT